MYNRYFITLSVFALLMIFQLAPAFERGGGGGGDRRQENSQGESGGGDRRQQENSQGMSGQDTYVPRDASGNSYREGSQGSDAAKGYRRGYQSGENNEENQQQQYYQNPYPYGVPPQQQAQPYQQQQSQGWQQQSGQPD